MPTVSRLKFVNVGHHNAFFNDLIIDARRWNANTFVLAANGVGKSSLIGLVFSLLRPYSYDFPYGEGQKKKRELSDYIPADSPSHVIIEWILDNQNTSNNLRYLVTGMVIERNAKNIDSLYYSYEHNQLREADEKSIADIPIYNEKDTFNSLKNIRGFLRDLKDKNPRQKVNYTEVKKAWLDILDYYYIDPELYRVQATMNQREGNQASIMDFRDSPEFINRLIELITPLDNLEEVESTIQSIKSHYTEVKNLPKYKEENAFLQNIIPKLKEGETLSSQSSKIRNDLLTIYNDWRNLKGLNDQLIEFVSIKQKSLEEQLKELQPEEDSLKQQREEKENQYWVVKEKSEANKQKVLLNDKKISSESKTQIDTEIRLLDLLPQWHDIVDIRKDKTILEQRLQTINEPLQKQLIEKGDTYARCLNSYIEYYSFKQDELRKTIQLQENSKENITLKIGGTKADLKNVNEHIKNQESIVSKVDKREKELRPLWQDFKSFQDGLLHYSHEYEEKLTFRDKLNADLEVCENDRTVLKNKETELKQDLASKDQILQNVETRLNDVSKRWSELTNIRLFKVLVDPELSGSITPDYQLLSEDKISEWRSTVSNLENDKFELQNKISSLKYDLEYYTKSKFFPPPREVNDLLQTLKFQNYAVQYGWEYLAQNFQNNVAFIEKWAQEYPYLLDGIVVIYPDLSEMKNIVNNLNIHFLESSIYFTSAKAFTSTFSSQLVNNESFVLGTALMWRYKFELLEDRAKKIESEVQTSSNKIVEIENTIIERNTFIEICMKFRTRCSEQEYQDLKNEQITRKNEIDLLKRELDELSDEENQLNIKLKSLRLNIKTTSTNIETLNKNIIALENFKQLFEERKETLTKIEDFRKKEQTFRNEQEKLEKDLGTINTAIENTRMQEKYYIDWLKDYNKIFPEITTTIKLSKKSTDIKPTLNIDDLAREYNTIKDILKNNKDLQTIYRQIEEKNVSLREKTNKFDIMKEQKKVTQLQIEQCDDKYSGKTVIDISQIKEDKQNQSNELFIKISNIESQLKENKRSREEIDNKVRTIPTEIKNRVLTSLGDGEVDKILIEIDNERNQLSERLNTILLKKTEAKTNNDKLIALKSRLGIHDVQLKNQLKLIEDSIGSEIRSTELLLHNLNLDTENEYEFLSKNFESIESKSTQNLEPTQIKIKELNIQQERLKNYALEINKLAKLPENSPIEKTELIKRLLTFSSTDVYRSSNYRQEMETRLKIITEMIESQQRTLTTIVETFNERTLKILQSIHDLSLTKISTPNIASVHNKQIIKIDLGINFNKKQDQEYIYKQIENFFNNLFIKNDSFPDRYNSLMELLKSLVQEVLHSRLNKVTFLFPSPNYSDFQYRDLQEALKGSGGETTTIAIMLYCLIAYFRLKQQQSAKGRRTRNFTSTLIMDNPFGKANRSDFVEMQISLAKSLGIQLLVFSGLEEINIHQQFDTVVALQSYSHNGGAIIELDPENKFNYIRGDSITRLTRSTINSYFDEEPAQDS